MHSSVWLRVSRSTLATVLLAATLAIVPTAGSHTAVVQAAAATPAAGADEINGTVWLDLDGDGVNDASETGFTGAAVSLYNSLGDLVGTVSTTATGLYSFTGLDPAAGPFRVEVTRSSTTYPDPSNWVISSAPGPVNGGYTGTDNDVVAQADARFGTATGVVPGTSIDVAMRPRPELSLGFFGPGIIDGTGPFTACANPTDQAPPGGDCGDDNNQLRTGDTLTSVWSITASNFEPGTTTIGDIIFEQTLTPVGGAIVSFERIPVSCTPPPNGTGGTGLPASVILNNYPTAGQTTLRCNLGQFSEGSQESLTTAVKLSSLSPNGSSFTMSEQVYAAGSRAIPDIGPSVGPIITSARPAYDLTKMSFRDSQSATRCVDSDNNAATPCETVRGQLVYTLIRIAQDQKVGIEAIQQPFTFTEDLAFTLGDGTTPYDGEWYITECIANPSGWGDVVLGRPFGRTALTHPTEYPRTLDESGTCVPSRASGATNTDKYTMTLSGADLDGSRFPTQTWGGATLAAGPFIVIEHRVSVFVPFRAIDTADGTVDNAGSITITNRYSGFDPVGISGTSNFGDGVEPGFCVDSSATCDLMSNGTRSNNVIGPLSILITVNGTMSKYQVYRTNNWSDWSRPPGSAANHDGAGQTEPGDYTAGMVSFQNTGSLDLINPGVCDVFDNTVFQLATANNVQYGATANRLPNAASRYAYVTQYSGLDTATVNSAFNVAWPNNWRVEYASLPISGDNPLYAASRVGVTGVVDSSFYPGVDTYNTVTGRFDGVWTSQRAQRCTDAAAATTGGWVTDPALVPGGLDAVNAVRAVPVDPAFALPPTGYMRLIVPMRTRSTFFGGPYADSAIPNGTVYANYGLTKADNLNQNGGGLGGWRPSSYNPSPESSNTDGDRVTLSRFNSSLTKRTLTPLTNVGASTSTLAGNQIVWELIPQVSTALVPSAEIARNVVITDALPPYTTYNAACTAALNNVPATATILPVNVEIDTRIDGTAGAGYTRLTYNLGDLPVNVAIPRIRVCTDTDPLAPNGTNVTNIARLTATDDITALASRQDDHTIILEQNGSMQISKIVDRRLDPINDSQVYTIEYANFATAFNIDPPTMIDVFPWNGDGAGSLSERDPASDYTGTLQLAAAPTVTFKNGSVPTGGDPFAAIGTFTYTSDAPATISYNPDVNTSTWCAEAAFSTAGCPASFAEVTAFKFVSNYALAIDGNPRQGHKVTFTLNAAGNQPSDRYTNRAAVDSASLPASQFLRSNNVVVEVASFNLGDLLFADINNDGRYTAAIDRVAPENVTIELYRASDDTLVGTTTTAANGRWQFTGVGEGDYYVVVPATMFASGAPLFGWNPAINPVADPNTDVNEAIDHHAVGVSAGTGVDGVRSGTVTISATVPVSPLQQPFGNEPTGDNVAGIASSIGDAFTNYTIDLGIVGTATMGDRVWFDTDGDGVQDSGEPGINGVTVTARWAGFDGIAGNADVVVYTVVTSGDGAWTLANLPVGNYTVTTSNVDTDFAASHDLDGLGTINTTAVSLAPNQVRTDVDFGYTVRYTLGNLVFADANHDGNFDVGIDRGIANVTVQLYRDGTTIPFATTTTDANGNYSFTGLAAGDYFVRIPNAEFTVGDLVGHATQLDGVADPNNDADQTVDHNAFDGPTGGAVTGPITLSATLDSTSGAIVSNEPSGAYANNTLDLGFIPPIRPAITIKKYTNGVDADTITGPFLPVGSTVTWEYRVTNTGDVALTNFLITDDAGTAGSTGDDFVASRTSGYVSGDTDNDNLFDVGETWILRRTGTAVAGQYGNIAVVEALPADPSGVAIPGSTVVTDDDPSHYFGATTGIDIEKSVQTLFDADAPSGPNVALGAAVQWTYLVTNTGNTRLNNVVVTDDVIGAVTCPATTLAAGASMTCTMFGTADVAGPYTNIGTATGTPVDAAGTPVVGLVAPSDSDAANHFVAAPGISITKNVQTIFEADLPNGPLVKPGTPVMFTYTVTNTGNTPLTGVVVTDDVEGAVSCPASSLAVGEQMTCELTTTAAVAGTLYANTGSVAGTAPTTFDANGDVVAGEIVRDSNDAHYVAANPSIDVQKFVQTVFDANTGNGPAIADGDIVRFTYVVTNTGNVPLDNVAVNDNVEGAITCPETFLGTGQQMTCTLEVVARNGNYTNIGTATGVGSASYDPTGALTVPGDIVADTDPAAYFGVAPRLEIVKTVQTSFDADVPTGPRVAAGSVVRFGYTVTNTGNVPLVAVTVTDDMIDDDSRINCGFGADNAIPSLAVGASVECVLFDTAINSGQYTNIGSAAGTGPTTVDADGNTVPGVSVGANDPANYYVQPVAINVETSVQSLFDADLPADGPTVAADADVLITYTVTNPGGAPLSNVTLTDATLGTPVYASGDTNGDGLLDPTETWIFTLIVPAGAAGTHGSTATVTGTGPETINTIGNDVPGATVTDGDAHNWFVSIPAVDVEKSVQTSFDADVPTGPLVAAGGDVRFTYVVTNTGNVPLSGVAVSDDVEGPITCPATTLAVGASMTCEITVPAISGGQYTNTGTATGTGPSTVDVDGNPIPGASVTDDDDANYFSALPAVDIEKLVQDDFDADTAPGPLVEIGADVTFTYVVTNTGNVALADVTVTDDVEGPITCPATTLAVGASMTCEITVPAISGGQYTNTGTATGTGPSTVGVDGNPIPGASVTDADDANYFVSGPAIDIEKSVQSVFDADLPTGPLVAAGDDVKFTYVVTNTGTVALENIVVTDDVEGVVACPQTTLAVGQSMTCEITVAAIASGQYTNTGTATGSSPVTYDINGDPIPGVDVSDDDDANYYAAVPSIDIEKFVQTTFDADTATGPLVAEAAPVKFTYVVTNTGNVALSGVVVNDDVEGAVTCPQTTLAVGASMTCELLSVAQDVDQYINIGAVSAVGPPSVDVDGNAVPGVPVTDTDRAHYVTAIPLIGITKSVQTTFDADTAPGPLVAGGGAVLFTYLVANLGNVVLSDVVVVDDVEGAVTCPQTTLAVGESMTCTVSAVAIASGLYTNTGSVTANSPATYDVDGNPVPGTPVSASNDANYTATAPAISVEKFVQSTFDADVAPGPMVQPGSPVTFTYLVTNTGNVALTGVSVTDDIEGVVSCPQTTLAIDESMTCTLSTTAVASGQYTNVGTAQGVGPDTIAADGSTVDGVTVTDTDPANYLVALPALQVVKSVNGVDANEAPGPSITIGKPVTFTYVVTNTGNTVVTAISLVDDREGAITCPATSLAIGESMTCTLNTVVSALGLYTNVGTVTGTGGSTVGPDGGTVPGLPVEDTDPANYTGIALAADLAITKAVSAANTMQGSTVVWTLTVVNNGPDAASDVKIYDVLPPSATLGAVPAGATYDPATRTLTWSVGTLAAGASASVSFSTVVDGDVGLVVINSASTDTTTAGDATGDNTAIASTILFVDVTRGSRGVSPGTTLPVTGGNVDDILRLAAFALLGGVALMLVVGRRRRSV